VLTSGAKLRFASTNCRWRRKPIHRSPANDWNRRGPFLWEHGLGVDGRDLRFGEQLGAVHDPVGV
jgi:hypothetical protein